MIAQEIMINFFKGIAVGYLASIPLGPIGVLCIQRTLSKSYRSGIVSGLGAATADTIFAMIAAFSLSLVMGFIDKYMSVIKIVGGIFVIIMGVYVFLTNVAVQIRKNRAGKGSIWSDYLTMFLLTLANPAFILVFVAMFAAFGVGGGAENGSFLRGFALISGVTLGATGWWLTPTSTVNLVRKKFRPRHLMWINRISGALIVLLGSITILSIFFSIPLLE